jgi:hypothetical protein
MHMCVCVCVCTPTQPPLLHMHTKLQAKGPTMWSRVMFLASVESVFKTARSSSKLIHLKLCNWVLSCWKTQDLSPWKIGNCLRLSAILLEWTGNACPEYSSPKQVSCAFQSACLCVWLLVASVNISFFYCVFNDVIYCWHCVMLIKWVNEWLCGIGDIWMNECGAVVEEQWQEIHGTWWNTCLNSILLMKNTTWTLLGLNLGLWGERLAASHLSQGRACNKCCALTCGRYIVTTQQECAKHMGSLEQVIFYINWAYSTICVNPSIWAWTKFCANMLLRWQLSVFI